MTDFNEEQEQARSQVCAALRVRLEQRSDPLAHVLLAARLASLGEVEGYRNWPRVLAASDAASLPGAIATACAELVGRIRIAEGEALADALLEAQAFACLLAVDREHGGLLQGAYGAIEGVDIECRHLPLDNEAAWRLGEEPELALLEPEHLLTVLVAPIGLSASAALAMARLALGSIPLKPVCRVPVLESELVFDMGRPSDRMIERFAERRGVVHLDDGTNAQVRAVLEEDWQVTVQFDAEESWCERIDRVRLGARAAEPLDLRADSWTTSLADLGLDAQTRLVNQPIMVLMATGERFSL